LIEAEKENLRNQISRFNENLANHAAFTERLMRQIKTLSAKERELTAKITANIKAGNKRVAGQLALQLQTVKSQLDENQQQLEIAEKTFKDLERSRDVAIREAQGKIEKLQALVSETQMLEAQADLQEMAKGMIGGIGGSGDTVNRVTELLHERRDKAAGKARVAAGSYDNTDMQMKESEQEALGDAALAEFMSMSGMDTTVTPEDVEVEPVPERGMGPMEKN
jgi:phage shock protein A